MTNLELDSKINKAVTNERKMTAEAVRLIAIADERKLYHEHGYPSLFAWLTQKHKYSESSAYRRIEAARLLRAVPAIAEKIESGEATLSGIAKVQTAIRAQEKACEVSAEQKQEAVELLKVCSRDQLASSLVEMFPESASAKPTEKTSAIGVDLFRINLAFTAEEMQILKRAQELLSHAVPEGGLAAAFVHLAKDLIKRKDPLKIKPDRSRQNTSAVKPHGKKIPAALRRQVFQRDRGRCTHLDPRTGHRCESRYQMELDHIEPVALGGKNTIENLRCLCAVHTQLRARQTFGDRRRNRVGDDRQSRH